MKRLAAILVSGLPVFAQVQVSLEGTAYMVRRNEVRKPSDGGTTFSLSDLVGTGPVWAPRMDLSWKLNERQALRVLLAPFEVKGTGIFPAPVVFQGTTFAPGVPTEGLYQFNSWRLTWRYTMVATPEWTLLLGATAKIRDAKVQLRQGGLSETTSDLGFVPLAHLYAERRLGGTVSVVFETDALAAPQGRAVDAALMLRWKANKRVHLDLGYRLLEGGADNDKIYTWARLDGWRLGIGATF